MLSYIGGESDTAIFEPKIFDSDISRVLPIVDRNW